MKRIEEREHVRVFRFLKRELQLKKLTPPIFGVVRNCVGLPESFVIRAASDVHIVNEGNRCVGVTVPTQHGTLLTMDLECDFSVRIGNDAAGKAIFLTNLNE